MPTADVAAPPGAEGADGGRAGTAAPGAGSTPAPAAAPPARRGLRRMITVALIAACAGTALLAVPDLRPVTREIAAMDPLLVAAAVALEVASCLSFVVIFRLFFAPVPPRAARELAWSQMGSGALLPGGGVGSLAVGGWLLHLAGMSTRQIVRRSSGLFFLTSAINVFALAAAGLLLWLGIADGPHDVLRAGLPVLAGAGACALALALPPAARRLSARRLSARRLSARRLSGQRTRTAWLGDVASGIDSARQTLTRPSWRLAGALGYLLFDIAVLWLAFAAVGPLPPVAPLVVAYLVGYLANAIPIPGGVGVLDAGLVGALTLYGLPLTHAAAAVLVYHAIAFWIPTLGGALGYVRVQRQLAGDGAPTIATVARGATALASSGAGKAARS